MIFKLLVLNFNSTSIEGINSIVNSEYPNIDLYILDQHQDIISDVQAISPEIVLFDLDSQLNHEEKSEKLLYRISHDLNLPVIAFSSKNLHKTAFEAGAINFIQKPFKDVTLISNLKSTLSLIDIQEAIYEKEREIEEKNVRIQFQIENELKQREIIIRKNKEVMADIRYASRIQQAILPSIEYINEHLQEYFILHQPKSHVGGDFYWLNCQGNRKIIAVGDCTGHGISGALMHMLGSVYLNEIINAGIYETASDILEQLRDHIMRSLNQTGELGETQDGLDIALCVVDCNKKKLQYSGANNPLYIIKNKELTEIRGDRMPVGIHVNFDKPFTNQVIDIESDDQIYLFSDGFADQFGGPKNKKFRYKQFKELLVKICHEPMNIQKEILNNSHDKWRGSAEQIDDILVFGIKIK